MSSKVCRNFMLTVAFLVSAPGLFAGFVTYQYIGNDFTTINGSQYTTSEHVTIELTFNVALPTDSALTSYTPTSFSFGDGQQGLNSVFTHNLTTLFEFATTGGVITQWELYAIDSVDSPEKAIVSVDGCSGCEYPIFDSGANNAGPLACGSAPSCAVVVGNPGVWTETISSAPEPSTLSTFLLAAALAFAGKLYQRRRRRAASARCP